MKMQIIPSRDVHDAATGTLVSAGWCDDAVYTLSGNADPVTETVAYLSVDGKLSVIPSSTIFHMGLHYVSHQNEPLGTFTRYHPRGMPTTVQVAIFDRIQQLLKG